MKRISSIVSTATECLLAFLIFAIAATAGWAQVPGNGVAPRSGLMVGEWKLLPLKSDFGGGQKLMGMEAKVSHDGADGIEYTISVTYESGMHADYTFNGLPDGKNYSIEGGATLYSYTEESGVVHETQRDPDGTVTKGDFTVSANGKLGTWKYTVTNPDGAVIHQRLVFARTA